MAALSLGGPTSTAEDTLRRLRAMRLRLAAHITLGSVRQRNRPVYRAHDAVGGRTTELSALAAELLVRCDGAHGLADLIGIVRKRQPEMTEQQATEEVLAVVRAAEAGGLLLPVEMKPEGFVLPAQPSIVWRTLKNPLFARFSLFSPAAFFNWLAPLAMALFSPAGLIAWLAIVGTGIALVVANWGELMAHAADQGLAAHNLVWIILLFPLVKVLHEIGHGLACRRWGGEVRDFGISLMVFVPIPYVDCSDSAFFVRRRQRVVVAAAGMMVEFVIASFALAAWLVSTDELTRVLAFNLMVLTSITTVLFNANPLMRYDAYYILSELSGVDNLASKSQQLIGGWARQVFAGERRTTPRRSWAETLLLLFYGVGSFLYRIFIVFAIVVGILPRFFFVGAVLAIWAGVAMIGQPLGKRAIAGFAYLKAASPGKRRRVLGGVLGVALPLVALLAIPLPYAVVADGAIRLPPEAVVRVAEAGMVDMLPQGEAGIVVPGAALVQLDNPLLDAELVASRATLVSLQRRYEALLASNLAEAALARAELEVTAEDVLSREQRRAELTIVAPVAGRFEIADGIVPGIHVEAGAAVGVVLGQSEDRLATVIVSQEDADLIGSRPGSVAIRPVGSNSLVRPASIAREYAVIVRRDAEAEGGPSESRFAFELRIASGGDLPYGQALKVKFDLGYAPLAVQAWRSLHIWYEKLMLSRYIGSAG